MLVDNNGVLIPHDMNMELFRFVKRNAGETRFVIALHIPEATHSKFQYDVGHIVTEYGVLKIRSQRGAHSHQLDMYAWEHVYCLMPSAKANRKSRHGWVSHNAGHIITDPQYNIWGYGEALTQYVQEHCHATA